MVIKNSLKQKLDFISFTRNVYLKFPDCFKCKWRSSFVKILKFLSHDFVLVSKHCKSFLLFFRFSVGAIILNIDSFGVATGRLFYCLFPSFLFWSPRNRRQCMVAVLHYRIAFLYSHGHPTGSSSSVSEGKVSTDQLRCFPAFTEDRFRTFLCHSLPVRPVKDLTSAFRPS